MVRLHKRGLPAGGDKRANMRRVSLSAVTPNNQIRPLSREGQAGTKVLLLGPPFFYFTWKVSNVPDAEPTPVKIVPDQPAITVIQVAPDGVTPVPIPALGIEANTPPGGDAPVGQPTPVAATGTPVNVTVMAPRPLAPTVTKGEGTTLSPTTTEEQDTVTAGQREINRIWERTQSWIALMVVFAGVMVNSVIVTAIIFFNKETSVTQLALISISLQFINLTTGIVIGFYFSRVNHQATGGVGPKPQEGPYVGR